MSHPDASSDTMNGDASLLLSFDPLLSSSLPPQQNPHGSSAAGDEDEDSMEFLGDQFPHDPRHENDGAEDRREVLRRAREIPIPMTPFSAALMNPRSINFDSKPSSAGMSPSDGKNRGHGRSRSITISEGSTAESSGGRAPRKSVLVDLGPNTPQPPRRQPASSRENTSKPSNQLASLPEVATPKASPPDLSNKIPSTPEPTPRPTTAAAGTSGATNKTVLSLRQLDLPTTPRISSPLKQVHFAFASPDNSPASVSSPKPNSYQHQRPNNALHPQSPSRSQRTPSPNKARRDKLQVRYYERDEAPSSVVRNPDAFVKGRKVVEDESPRSEMGSGDDGTPRFTMPTATTATANGLGGSARRRRSWSGSPEEHGFDVSGDTSTLFGHFDQNEASMSMIADEHGSFLADMTITSSPGSDYDGRGGGGGSPGMILGSLTSSKKPTTGLTSTGKRYSYPHPQNIHVHQVGPDSSDSEFTEESDEGSPSPDPKRFGNMLRAGQVGVGVGSGIGRDGVGNRDGKAGAATGGSGSGSDSSGDVEGLLRKMQRNKELGSNTREIVQEPPMCGLITTTMTVELLEEEKRARQLQEFLDIERACNVPLPDSPEPAEPRSAPPMARNTSSSSSSSARTSRPISQYVVGNTAGEGDPTPGKTDRIRPASVIGIPSSSSPSIARTHTTSEAARSPKELFANMRNYQSPNVGYGKSRVGGVGGGVVEKERTNDAERLRRVIENIRSKGTKPLMTTGAGTTTTSKNDLHDMMTNDTFDEGNSVVFNASANPPATPFSGSSSGSSFSSVRSGQPSSDSRSRSLPEGTPLVKYGRIVSRKAEDHAPSIPLPSESKRRAPMTEIRSTRTTIVREGENSTAKKVVRHPPSSSSATSRVTGASGTTTRTRRSSSSVNIPDGQEAPPTARKLSFRPTNTVSSVGQVDSRVGGEAGIKVERLEFRKEKTVSGERSEPAQTRLERDGRGDVSGASRAVSGAGTRAGAGPGTGSEVKVVRPPSRNAAQSAESPAPRSSRTDSEIGESRPSSRLGQAVSGTAPKSEECINKAPANPSSYSVAPSSHPSATRHATVPAVSKVTNRPAPVAATGRSAGGLASALAAQPRQLGSRFGFAPPSGSILSKQQAPSDLNGGDTVHVQQQQQGIRPPSRSALSRPAGSSSSSSTRPLSPTEFSGPAMQSLAMKSALASTKVGSGIATLGSTRIRQPLGNANTNSNSIPTSNGAISDVPSVSKSVQKDEGVKKTGASGSGSSLLGHVRSRSGIVPPSTGFAYKKAAS